MQRLANPRRTSTRTRAARARPPAGPLAALGVGLLHGVGGSAGVGILIVATMESTSYTVVALGVLAAFAAVSLTILTVGMGATLASRPPSRSYTRVAPTLGAFVSVTLGTSYAAAALELAPYAF